MTPLKMISLGYSLCDNSVGVLYNDSTRIVLHEDGDKLQYVDKDFRETFCTVREHPSELKKKVSLVDYFRKYMNEHLLKVKYYPRNGVRFPGDRSVRKTHAFCIFSLVFFG